MKLYCEAIALDVLPPVRSIIAKELLTAGLNQTQVAQHLKISQPAVSQYLRNIRGTKELEGNTEIKKALTNICQKLLSNKCSNVYRSEEFSTLCNLIMSKKLVDGVENVNNCNICDGVRNCD